MKLIITTDDTTSAAAALGLVVGCLERMRVDNITHQGNAIIISSETYTVLYDKTPTGTHTFRIKER